MVLHCVSRFLDCRRVLVGLFTAAAILSLEATLAHASEDRRASSARKPAWEWSVEERLAERFDPVAIEARADAHRARSVNLSARSAATDLAPAGGDDHAGPARRTVDTIHGAETPELFLTWEIFDQLVSLGFSPDGDNQGTARHLVEERAAALGFGMDLWQRIEIATSPLLELRREEARLAMVPYRNEMAEGSDRALLLCRARDLAIATAKEEFGEEKFLRLLYGAVAPAVSRTYIVEESLADQLRFMEGGCK